MVSQRNIIESTEEVVETTKQIIRMRFVKVYAIIVMEFVSSRLSRSL